MTNMATWILTDLYSNQLNDAYTYRCMTNMAATTQKMKNYKGISVLMLMNRNGRGEDERRENKTSKEWLEGQA